MKEIIVVTREELEEIINNCFARYLSKQQETTKQQEQLFYSLRELADFLGCSVVTAQHLKKSGKIRYRQFGRKLIFSSAEIMEDLNRNKLKRSVVLK